MSIECIVLDFDGTFTLVDREAVPFLEGFVDDLRGMIGAQAVSRWDDTMRRVKADPDRYGWENEGRIVAPSHADPYILATTIGQLLLEESGVASRAERTEKLQTLYQRNYPKALTVFRPEARDVIEAVVATGWPVFVVTNSRTAHVEAKIASLVPQLKDRISVRGDARKFVLTEPEQPDEAWAKVPSELHVAGLTRPIYPRRGAYYEQLRKIWAETNGSAATTLVCGDIFELDLALPAELGARIHLVARPETPDYERRAARGRPAGSVSADLGGLLEVLELPG
jgi:phosphoglycolate phosphatase-like HAD superfamily hydrolase